MYIDFIDLLIAKAEKRRSLKQGAFLFHQGGAVHAVYVVEDGAIALTRFHEDGTSLVLQHAGKRSLLAEASVYSDVYHCHAIAEAPTSVFEMRKAAFLACFRDDVEFAQLWARHLAREVQSARVRSEILSRKTVAERLDGWLAWRNGNLPAKGQWKSVATQIGVSVEALYRELAKRRSA